MRLAARLFATSTIALWAVAGPAMAQDNGEGEGGEPARGSVKIEDEDMGEPDTPNEVKVGCAFRIDFFGFDEQTVPVRLSLQPPSGDQELTERQASLEDARGNEPSGSLTVDLTDELSSVPPADPEDYDYKVRVDVVVKESNGSEVTKSTMLFIDCQPAVEAFAAAQQDDEPETEVLSKTRQREEPADEAGDGAAQAEEVPQPTVVSAGSAGLAATHLPVWVAVLMMIGLGAMVAAVATMHVRRRAADH